MAGSTMAQQLLAMQAASRAKAAQPQQKQAAPRGQPSVSAKQAVANFSKVVGPVKKKDSGGGDFFDQVLSNPIVHGALEALNLPGRFVRGSAAGSISSIQDILDNGLNADPESFITTAANLTTLGAANAAGVGYLKGQGRDAFSQNKGMGGVLEDTLKANDIHDTPLNNIWAKRALGFAGDVATDPLVYVAPDAELAGGAAKVATRVGDVAEAAGRRTTLDATNEAAQHLMRNGLFDQGAQGAARDILDRGAADAAGIGDRARAVQAVIGQRGPGGLDQAARDEFLNGATGGLKFNEPGSGRLGQKLGLDGGRGLQQGDLIPKDVTDVLTNPLRDLRMATRATKVGQAFTTGALSGRGGVNQTLEAAFRSGDPEQAGAAVTAKQLFGSEGLKGQAAINKSLDEYARISQQFKGPDKELFQRALEGDQAARDALDTKGLDWQPARTLLDAIETKARKAGVQFGHQEDYLPRVLSGGAKDAYGVGQGGAGAGDFAHIQGRTMVEGTQLEGGPVLEGTQANMRDQVNQWAKDQGIPDGYYENNPDKVVPDYIKGMHQQIARSATEQALYSRGIGGPAWERVAKQTAVPSTELETPRNIKFNMQDTNQQINETQALIDAGKRGPKAMPHALKLDLLEQRKTLLNAAAQETDPELRRVAVLEANANAAELGSLRPKPFDPSSIKTTMVPQLKETVRNGIWQEMGNGKALPADVADALNRVDRLVTPEGLKGFFNIYDKVLHYIKGWELATPGFITRFATGHAWNGFLADMEVGAYSRFLADSKAYREGTLTGDALTHMQTIEPFMGAHVGQYSSHEIANFDKTSALFQKVNPLSSRNLYVTSLQHGMQKVTEFMRGAMLYDTVRNGGTAEEAAARMFKFHFDYADLSSFERSVVKRVIPFYTWTRKALPLQFEMLLENPGKFSKYIAATRAMQLGTTPDSIVPSYFNETSMTQTPFSVDGNSVYANPRLPFMDANNVLPFDENGFQPGKPLSMVTPVLKTPIERIANKQFFKDIPLTEGGKGQQGNPIPAAWDAIPGLTPALETLGMAKDGKIGNRDAYTVEQFLPLLARLRRLAPSEPKYQQRALSSWLSFTGLAPVAINTPYEQKMEKYRQFLDDSHSVSFRVPNKK